MPKHSLQSVQEASVRSSKLFCVCSVSVRTCHHFHRKNERKKERWCHYFLLFQVLEWFELWQHESNSAQLSHNRHYCVRRIERHKGVICQKLLLCLMRFAIKLWEENSENQGKHFQSWPALELLKWVSQTVGCLAQLQHTQTPVQSHKLSRQPELTSCMSHAWLILVPFTAEGVTKASRQFHYRECYWARLWCDSFID